MREVAMHPAEEALMDVVEGVAAGEVRRHLAGCAACTARVQEVRAALALAGEAEVPEPSPFYWQAFRNQVGRRISVERRSRRVLMAPLAAAAALAAVVAFLPRGAGGPSPARVAATLPAWSALPTADEDAGFDVVAALAGGMDEGEAAVDCRGTGECLAELSEEESRALAELLRRELPAGERP